MIPELEHVRDYESLQAFADQLYHVNVRIALADAITESRVVFPENEYWPEGDIQYVISSKARTDGKLKYVMREEKTERTLHILQLCAAIAPGLAPAVNELLRKTTG